MGGGCPELYISDLMYTYYRKHFDKLVFGKTTRLEVCKKLEDRNSQRRFSAALSQSLLLYSGPLIHRSISDRIALRCDKPNLPYLKSILV